MALETAGQALNAVAKSIWGDPEAVQQAQMLEQQLQQERQMRMAQAQDTGLDMNVLMIIMIMAGLGGLFIFTQM